MNGAVVGWEPQPNGEAKMTLPPSTLTARADPILLQNWRKIVAAKLLLQRVYTNAGLSLENATPEILLTGTNSAKEQPTAHTQKAFFAAVLNQRLIELSPLCIPVRPYVGRTNQNCSYQN